MDIVLLTWYCEPCQTKHTRNIVSEPEGYVQIATYNEADLSATKSKLTSTFTDMQFISQVDLSCEGNDQGLLRKILLERSSLT